MKSVHGKQKLSLGELRRFSRLVQSVLFALLHAGVAREEACLFDFVLVLSRKHQSAAYAVTYGARLTGKAAAVNIDGNVVFGLRIGENQRQRQHYHQRQGY